MSVTITSIKDPFNEFRNIIQEEEYHGGVLSDYIDYSKLNDPTITYIICINGIEVQDKNTPINDDDKISVVAKIEATLASMAAGAIVGPSSFGAAMGAGFWTALGYAAVFTVAYVGIMYGMSAISKSTLDSSSSSSSGSEAKGEATYGWDQIVQTTSEGVGIPYIYGAVKISGEVINQFVDIDGNNETLNVLLGVCDHQIDSITDIRINEQPSTYYKDTETYTRLGTNSDELIDGFNDIVTQIAVDSKLVAVDPDDSIEHPIVQQTAGDVVQKINIDITCPSGVYSITDAGHVDSQKVGIKVEYRVLGTTTWILDNTYLFKENTTQAVRKRITIDNLAYGQYEVRVTRTNHEPDDIHKNSAAYFSSMQEIVKETLTYPGIAKYAIKVLATDQLSGTAPILSCIATRNNVSVFDKDLATPIWNDKRATNPAWIVYSLLVEFAGIDQDRLIWEDFSEWADYCDESIDDGNGGYEYRIALNVVINSGDFWTQIQKIALYGRATIIRRGTYYGVFVDKYEGDPPTISHLFTMGNTLEGSFTMHYLALKDRATAIEIEYNDIDREYTKQVLTVYSDDYLLPNTNETKASVTIEAAITQSQALREGVFRINNNKYLIRTISFDAAIDSFACTVGDLFYFQHETIDYGRNQTGSRIIEAGNDGSTSYVKLDQTVDLLDNTTYKITVRLEDDSLVEKTVTNSPGTTDVLTFADNWTSIPKTYDLFLFGPVDTYKKIYRLVNVTRRDDFTRTITGFEYIPDIYLNNDNYVIEEIDDTPKKQEAIHVDLNEFLSYEQDGSYKSNINVAWNCAYTQSGQNWSIWLEDTISGTPPVRVGDAFSRQYTIDSDLVLGDTYKCYVVPYGTGAVDTGGNTAEITIQGKYAPPSDVLNFIGTWDSIKRAVHFSWDAISDIDLAQYEIRQGTTWETGVLIKTTVDVVTSILIDEGVSEIRTYWIKAVDTSAIYSINAAGSTVQIDTTETTLTVPEGLSLSSSSGIASDGRNVVTLLAVWDVNAELSSDFNHYDILLEDVGNGAKSEYSTTDHQFQWEVVPNKQYCVTVRAVDVSGNFTDYAAQVCTTTVKDTTPPAIPTWPTEHSAIPGFKVIGLDWNDNTEYDFAYYILERSTTNDFSSDVTVLGQINASFNADSNGLDVSTTYYYRLKAVDTSGNESAYSSIVSATTLQIGTEDIAYNTIIAEHIAVDNLEAISADLGVITAGRIQNANDTTYLDLDADTMSLGDKLTWDGVNLNITGGLTVGAGSSGISNFTDYNDTTTSDIQLDTKIIDMNDSNLDTIGDVLTGGINQDDLTLLNVVGAAETINQLPGIANGIKNFDTRNDRIINPVEAPTINTDGTAISYSFNADGTANIDFRWNYNFMSSRATNIDGFNVYIDMMNESVVPTSWDGVKFYNVLPTQTMFRFSSLTTDKYYWIGIEAYRIVDQDLVPEGLLRSDLVIPLLAAEAPVHLQLDVPAPINVNMTEL